MPEMQRILIIGRGIKSIRMKKDRIADLTDGIGRKLIVCLLILTITSALSGCARKIEPVTKSSFMLNTFVTVTLYDKDDMDVLNGVLELCKSYENVFSKTIEDSEVYRLNHRAVNESTMTVSKDTADLIQAGLYYSERSGGAFDITVEPLSSLWDFTAETPVIPQKNQIEEAVNKVNYKKLEVTGDQVTFLSQDTSVDLGAIAKGYIADRMKDYLLEHGVNSAVINLGGNVLCVGTRPDGTPFRIGLQKPYADRNETIAQLSIDGKSVVSSGVYERHFVKDGVNYHHILNPKDGYPYENGLVSVTIISDLSVDGDGLSTTCFALGLTDGLELLNSTDGVYGIFITDDYEIHYSDGAETFVTKE